MNLKSVFRKIISKIISLILIMTPNKIAVATDTDITSGTCGTNVQWSFNTSTGELTISCSGAMTGIFDGKEAPWKLYKDSLKTVTIEHGVTDISASAFSEYKKLVKVTLPSSITSIGSHAFSECSNLISVTIPDSVTSIGISAFESCTSLTSVTIPESVNFIGECVFRYCSNLVKAIYMGTKDPVDPSADSVFSATNVSVVDVPTNYEGDTFGGLPVNKILPPIIKAFTQPIKYLYKRYRPILCNRFLLN